MICRTVVSILIAMLSVAGIATPASTWRIETVADGLEHPWSLAFLPDGRLLVTERAGRLRVIDKSGLLPVPVARVPAAYVEGQGGLFEVLPHPAFDENGWIYLSLAHGTATANTLRVIRGRLQENQLAEVETVFTAQPTRDTSAHYGGRMLFLPDSTLLITVGDGFDYREQAQKPDSHLGSIVRIHADGGVPADNPFVHRDNALPEIYSYGHRNSQGLVYDHESGIIWSHEHGPRGGDELNIIRAGGNYGWPITTHGRDYSGAIISPHKHLDGIVDPLRLWTPSIAPAGMAQYRGVQFPEWEGDLLIAGLVAQAVIKISLKEGTVEKEERLFEEVDERIRDVRVGSDGAIYLLTDSSQGRVLRVTRH